MDFYSHDELNQEIKRIQLEDKPPAFQGRHYPLEYLGPREFEILVYFLFKKEIESGYYKDKFDSIRLMKGVAERGRDNVLISQNKAVGVVQCKRYGRGLTLPETVREIIKFLLHSILDPSLLHKKERFTYYIVSLTGFNERAITFLSGGRKSLNEFSELESWANEVINENASLGKIKFEKVRDQLIQLFDTITLEPLTGTDIDGRLRLLKDIIPIFFEVEMVASEGMLDKKFQQYLGFKNDSDLERLRKRISDVPEGRRLRLGYFSIYGYDEGFYRKIAKDQTLYSAMADVKAEVNQRFIKYLQETIQTYQLIYVSDLPDISPFTKQAITPYLFLKFAEDILETEMGTVFTQALKAKSVETQSILEKIKAHLLEVGEKVLNNDFSGFVGDDDVLEFKRQLAYKIHEGFTSVKAMSARFDQDMQKLTPLVNKIEEMIMEIMPKNATIILQDSNILDNKEDVDRLLHEARKYD